MSGKTLTLPIRWSVLLGASCLSVAAHAYDGLETYRLTAEEIALLPDYCRHTQLIMAQHGSAAMHKEWTARVGEEFMHMHHYCISVVALVRSYRARLPAQDRSGYLGFAVENLTYVIDRARPDFVLLPEVLFRRGQAFQLLGRHDRAIKDLEVSLSLDPAQPRAAFALAQSLDSVGQRQQAREVVARALEKAPGSRLLQQELERLGRSR
jgi:tetratricopeptide (TPR) repeat protein